MTDHFAVKARLGTLEGVANTLNDGQKCIEQEEQMQMLMHCQDNHIYLSLLYMLVLSIDTFEPEMDMQSLFQMEPETALKVPESQSFAKEQRKDGETLAMTQYLEKGILPESTNVCRIATQAPLFTLIDEILYYLDDKQPGI